MSWRRMFSTPSPDTAFVLEEERVLALRSDRRGRLLAHASATLPPGTLQCGRVGLQLVQREALQPVLARLMAEVGGGRRPIVLLPTGWVRTHLLDLDTVPRKQAQLEEVVRWRLKKLLPVPAADLRLDLLPLAPANGRKRLLCVTALERALHELEEAFGAVGMEPSVITGQLFALAEASASAGKTLIVQQESGFLAVAVLDGDQPVVVRIKPLAGLIERSHLVLRELGVVWAYTRESLAVQGPVALCVNAQDEGMAAAVAAWGVEQEGLVLVAPRVVEGIEEAHRAAFAPAWGLLAGAAV